MLLPSTYHAYVSYQLPLLKDGNMFLSFHLESKETLKNFLMMILADTKFLLNENIMDYSVLIGVSFDELENGNDSVSCLIKLTLQFSGML